MARRRDDDQDDDLPKKKGKGRPARDEDDDDEVPKPSKNDAYTGLLGISLVALLAATVLFYLDADELASAPAAPTLTVPGLGEPPKAAAGGTTQTTPAPMGNAATGMGN